jgi:hypothetical protein
MHDLVSSASQLRKRQSGSGWRLDDRRLLGAFLGDPPDSEALVPWMPHE